MQHLSAGQCKQEFTKTQDVTKKFHTEATPGSKSPQAAKYWTQRIL